jgi:hypothetical protein
MNELNEISHIKENEVEKKEGMNLLKNTLNVY